MSLKPTRRSSRLLALALGAALMAPTSGCSIPSFGPFGPLLKIAYNAFATAINGALFGGTTTTSF